MTFRILACALLLVLSPLAAANAQQIGVGGNNEAESTIADHDDLGYANAPADSAAEIDRMEGLNRAIYGFNTAVDTALIRPVSEVYKFVFPRMARDRVTLFFSNLQAPVVFLNSVLQADPQNSFVTLWRFLINSTLGVAGLFDIATDLGVPARNEEDFGQTLAVWGVGHGSYFVLPIVGSSSLRDTVGFAVDIVTNPFTYVFANDEGLAIAMVSTQVVNTRARFGDFIDNTYETSLDPYATFRSLYLQRRDAQVSNRTDTGGTSPRLVAPSAGRI